MTKARCHPERSRGISGIIPTSNSPQQKLIRELQADHRFLVNVTIALVDKVAIMQGDIATIKTRLRKLHGGIRL